MGRHHPINLIVHVLFALIAALCFCDFTHAGTNREIRLFLVEKSKNPENILVVYCNVDADCEIQPIADAGGFHLFDLYWLMDGATFKPTHRLIKKAARKRFVEQELTNHGQSFTVLLADLKELIHDLPSDRIHVKMYRDPKGHCRAQVLLALGPSHANRTMNINAIYSEAKTFCSIPVGIHYIELRGKDTQTNESITARYNSNNQCNYSKTIEASKNTISD